MSKGHVSRSRAFASARAMNRKEPSMPNCTKVVRLFVVRPGRTLKSIVANEKPSRSDVVVRMNRDGNLEPMSWLGDVRGLVDHEQAHDEHVGTVLVLNGANREQIEWQCDVRFRLTGIKLKDGHETFPRVRGKRYPFITSLKKLQQQHRDTDRPLRSGPTKPGQWKQLYKAHFKLLIGRRWMDLDPDVYCEWR
jgi:hypothetical protein